MIDSINVIKLRLKLALKLSSVDHSARKKGRRREEAGSGQQNTPTMGLRRRESGPSLGPRLSLVR